MIQSIKYSLIIGICVDIGSVHNFLAWAKINYIILVESNNC